MTQPCRRRHPRLPLQLPAKVTLEGQEVQAETVNISLGGMFVQFEDNVDFGALVGQVGTWMDFQLFLPDQAEPVELRASVRWTDTGGGIGVQFGKLSLRATERLSDFLDEQTDDD